MKIGDIEIDGKVILGPMAGVTSLAYRDFMKPFGVALSYSEMISDCGLVYGNQKTGAYVATSKLDRPVGLQLFGSTIKYSVPAVEILEKIADYDILDVNLGCPVHKVVKTGAGSAWLKRPEELFEYMEAIVKASHKPVTAKIRLGWDDKSINVFEVSSLLERAGVKALSIHCRTTQQAYAGKADYEKIANLKENICIPLIVSGDIFTLDDAIRAAEITHADGIMVARGGLGNPFLVTQIDTYFRTGERLPNPSLKEQIGYAETFARLLLEAKGEDTACRELRGLLPHFFSGFPGYKKIRNQITQNLESWNDFEVFFGSIKEKAELL